jgi:predicted transcriptional regulator
MGESKNSVQREGDDRRGFLQAVMRDLEALESMIERGMIERGRRRIGAELEMFLVDGHWQPLACSLAVLKELDDPRFTTELAQFNLEANLLPVDFGSGALRRTERQLNTLVAKARSAAAVVGGRVICTGILPTIRTADLGLENLTPYPRYRALNDALTELRGESYEFRILGSDELLLKHDSVMVESCNASFQCHFQLSDEEFPHLYNIAQVLAGPVLSAVGNSPMLFGKRLWSETRIALFEQAVDTRRVRTEIRKVAPRVWFGGGYVRHSVLELFREDLSRFRALLCGLDVEDSLAVLEAGGVPKLQALCLHNGTVYRWNRACYGVTEGKPHLRIENRIIPSGPSTLDCVANAALWFGLMSALADQYDDITTELPFDRATGNFHAAARYGLGAELNWLDGAVHPAEKLLREQLCPMAREGLRLSGITSGEIDRYMGVIEERVEKKQTGSLWQLRSFEGMPETATPAERAGAITAALYARQIEGRPVAQWELARIDDGGDWATSFQRVDQFMRTELFTVSGEEPVGLVANMMDWNGIRHVLVEDKEHHLVGVVSYRSLLRVLGRAEAGTDRPISELMRRDPIFVTTDCPTLDAINLMRQHRLSCLPVVKDGCLVGVVTEREFLDITANLMEERLRPDGPVGRAGAA